VGGQDEKGQERRIQCEVEDEKRKGRRQKERKDEGKRRKRSHVSTGLSEDVVAKFVSMT